MLLTPADTCSGPQCRWAQQQRCLLSLLDDAGRGQHVVCLAVAALLPVEVLHLMHGTPEQLDAARCATLVGGGSSLQAGRLLRVVCIQSPAQPMYIQNMHRCSQAGLLWHKSCQ